MTQSTIQYSPSLNTQPIIDMDSPNSNDSENQIRYLSMTPFQSMKNSKNQGSTSNVISQESRQALLARIDAYKINSTAGKASQSKEQITGIQISAMKDISNQLNATKEIESDENKYNQLLKRSNVTVSTQPIESITEKVQKQSNQEILNSFPFHKFRSFRQDTQPNEKNEHQTNSNAINDSILSEIKKFMNYSSLNDSNLGTSQLNESDFNSSQINESNVSSALSDDSSPISLLKNESQSKDLSYDGQTTIEGLKALNSGLRKQLHEKNLLVQSLEKKITSQDQKSNEELQKYENITIVWLDKINSLQFKLSSSCPENILKQKPHMSQGNLVYEFCNDLLSSVITECDELIKKIESEASSSSSKQLAILSIQKIRDEANLRVTMNTLSGRFIDLLLEKDLALRNNLNQNESKSLKKKEKRSWRPFGRK